MDDRIKANFRDGSFKNTYEECVMQKAELQKYLQTSSEFHDGVVRKYLQKQYDYVNQNLYWYRFLVNEEEYKSIFYTAASDLVTQVRDFDRWQSLGTSPEDIAVRCENILKNPPKDQSAEGDGDYDCPYKFKLKVGISTMKEDCKGFEWEGGELLVLGFEKDYKSGEFTVAFGLGVGEDIDVIGIGAKGQMFFKFGKDFTPLDCGMRFESGGEITAGPLVVEEKMTAVIGMTSGISVDAVDNGASTNIFRLDPTQ